MTTPLRFAVSIPGGAVYDRRIKNTLISIASQKTSVQVALCECSQASEIHQLHAQYKDLIKYFRSGPDAGQSVAINEGWFAIDADIYSWLNVDDTLASGSLVHVADIFDRDHSIDVVYGQSNIIVNKSDGVKLHPAVEGPSDVLYRSNIISQPSCFVRAAAIKEVNGVNPNLHYAMDWDLWVRLCERGMKFHYTDKILSTVYWGRDTKTGSFNSRRVSELWNVVRRNNNVYTSLKTIAGFWQHHQRTY